jgi:hypothetical protein
MISSSRFSVDLQQVYPGLPGFQMISSRFIQVFQVFR